MLHPNDFVRVDGIRVTSVSRTLLDLGAVVPERELARAVDRAERLQVFDLVAVEDLLTRARGHGGSRALRAAIKAWEPRHTRSELEDRFVELVQEARLEQPRFNAILEGECGSHEVDAFWPSCRLAVDLDGFAFHHTRRDRERDAQRDADLELAGFRVVRLTWGDVTARSERTARRLRRLLA
jgi:very-short-patch-repair endonuclease